MPGIYGGVGLSPQQCEALRHEFAEAWTDCESVCLPGGILSGHAFGSRCALYTLSNGCHFAIDGEASLYRMAQAVTPAEISKLFRMSSGRLELTGACKGNVALVDMASGSWHLASEWAGTFPLYYFHRDNIFAFSSRLRPLARAFGAPHDPIGVLQFLLRGYTLAGRTHYQGIYRLMPGQVVSYNSFDRSLKVHETSRLWTDIASDDPRHLWSDSGMAWDTLKKAAQQCLQGEEQHALMMSAGWDSRLLLAMLHCLDAHHVHTYSYGDPGSRELRIAEAIGRSLGVEWHREPLNETIYALDALQQGFNRVENVFFPHWHRAGVYLAKTGVKCVSAGVYGEILGGHYGIPMLLQGREKMTAIATTLLGRPSRVATDSKEPCKQVYGFLRYRDVNKPGYLCQTFWENLPHSTEALNADINLTLQRFVKRGIVTADQLIEAFIAEHRGSQYISAQIRSCRGNLDIAIPFADRDLLFIASRIPLTRKIHNSLNRKILLSHAPDLLRFHTAATLVPAAMPIFLQEASRICRRLLDKGFWKLYFATNGRIGPFRTGWTNFEFLRHSPALHCLLQDLKSDIWDRKSLEHSFLNRERSHNRRIYPETFLKIYTTDLILR